MKKNTLKVFHCKSKELIYLEMIHLSRKQMQNNKSKQIDSVMYQTRCSFDQLNLEKLHMKNQRRIKLLINLKNFITIIWEVKLIQIIE